MVFHVVLKVSDAEIRVARCVARGNDKVLLTDRYSNRVTCNTQPVTLQKVIIFSE